ncbi:MAG TPA: DNA primase [Candidatus Marinimicrobia bacterium]|nr:DNA primase [Candidatus Neomarinimicrobiota bacterium]
MAKIPQDIVDRVRDTADIVDVVSQYVDLKHRGANYFGLCPFHGEKTPSFSVAPAKQIYHCFGCSTGGNVFSFLMEYQKVSFPEAVKTLADRYNIPIQYEEGEGSSELFSSLYELHNIAVKLYQDNLFSQRGESALAYLTDRGLTEDILKQFKVGFAMDSWDQLVKQCAGKGFTKSHINQSGLFTQSEKGTFDRFRSRVMFPIFHPSGKPIAFGGRIFGVEDPAKYLNSPETPLYKKSDVFYGLQASRDAIRKTGFAVLVEGYMDFLQLYQAGIHPLVAVSGTAFTQRHALALSRITQKVVLLYDGDNAGGNAAIRTGWVLLKAGLEPTIVRPPGDQDPDDWVRAVGRNDVLSAIESPTSFLDFHLEFHSGKSLEGAERRQYILDLMREIRSIQDGIVRNDLVRILSEKLMVDEHDLVRVMKSQRVNPVQYPDQTDQGDEIPKFTSIADRAQIELLQLLALEEQSTRQYVQENISLALFTTPLLKKVAGFLLDEKLSVESSAIIEYFQDKHERDSVAQILFAETQNIPPEQIVSDCLKILKSMPLKERIQSLRIQIREKESNGDDPQKELDEVIKLQQELNDI